MPKSVHPPRHVIRVLVVAGDDMTCDLLRGAFAHSSKDFAVETLVGSSSKVIGEIGTWKPNVALICDELEDGHQAGFKVLQKVRDSYKDTAAIMLLKRPEPGFVVGAFREGARGVFHRSHSLKALSKCIRTVHQGQLWACNEDIEHILNALGHTTAFQWNDPKGMPSLTRREEDVVRLVADGLKNREIAERLNVSEHSVRNYLYRIFEKLGVSTRVELILYAFNRRDRGN